ncbi:hypothetical protein [Streptomyces cylindrosporus]|uniref:Integral membrane protein n=1 Tax=Streptomyces cylindrosporus TaxID=2927583 RepID=A0ABS9YLQ6_9ACTN|nr:hypothetical protein [Streptomyces cylindrosporus]MCI3277480.1 hypothetical protein [Streptomyces cylindrosporus]
MHHIGPAVLAVAALAALALLLGARASWFYALLSLACLLQGASEAYQEHRFPTLGCLVAAAFFAGAAFHALFANTAAHESGS